MVSKEHIADVEALMRHWGYRYVESATWLWQAPTNRLEAQPAPLFRRSHSTLIIGRRGALDIQHRSLIASALPFGRACVFPCFQPTPQSFSLSGWCVRVAVTMAAPVEQQVDHEHGALHLQVHGHMPPRDAESSPICDARCE